MRLLLLLIIVLAVPLSTATATNGEAIECPVTQVVIGTIVTLALVDLQENSSYGVIVLESKRVLLDFTTADSYKRYVFSTIFKYEDVDEHDYIRLQLIRVEGEEWIICDELYLAVIESRGIPFQVTLFSVVMTLILVILFMGYVGARDFRRSRREKKGE